jgi:hypothetical protein
MADQATATAGADASAAAHGEATDDSAGQEATDHAKTGDGAAWSQATSADEARARDRAAGSAERDSTGERRGGRPAGGWREWADWAERRDWREWAAWAEQRDWREWAGKQDWKGRAKASQQDWKEWAKASKQEWAASGSRRPDTDLVLDLERLAAAFARELRGVAWQAEALSEDAVGSLGRILTDALNRIKNEVFRAPESGKDES